MIRQIKFTNSTRQMTYGGELQGIIRVGDGVYSLHLVDSQPKADVVGKFSFMNYYGQFAHLGLTYIVQEA